MAMPRTEIRGIAKTDQRRKVSMSIAQDYIK